MEIINTGWLNNPINSACFKLQELVESNKSTMSKEKKGVYTGIIEKDKDGNYFCGEYLLDYKYTEASFKIGDEINIKSVLS